MKFILIAVYIAAHVTVSVTADFETLEACEKACVSINEDIGKYYGIGHAQCHPSR